MTTWLRMFRKLKILNKIVPSTCLEGFEKIDNCFPSYSLLKKKKKRKSCLAMQSIKKFVHSNGKKTKENHKPLLSIVDDNNSFLNQ